MTEVIRICLSRLETAQGPRRLLHGRGGNVEGNRHVTVDWYPPYLLIGSFDGGEYPDLVAALSNHSEVAGVVLQLSLIHI